MKAVKVALLGACGWMGKCHSLGYRNAALLFPEKNVSPEIVWLVDEAERKLTELQPVYEGARISTDWREPIADPDVDLVDICLPDHLHHEAAKAAPSPASMSTARSPSLRRLPKRPSSRPWPLSAGSSLG